jgi:hypothetical protein
VEFCQIDVALLSCVDQVALCLYTIFLRSGSNSERHTLLNGRHCLSLFSVDMGVGVHACNPSYLGGIGRRIMSSRPTGAKLSRLYLRNKIQSKGWGMVQVVACLPSMCEALGSNSGITHTHTHTHKELSAHKEKRFI